MPINSIEKGKRAERAWSKFMQSFGFECRRGRQFSGGPESPDVIHNFPLVHIEVKWQERLNLSDAYAQAVRDAPDNTIPIVAFTKNQGVWMVAMAAEDMFKFRLRMEYLTGMKKVSDK
jgi:hypothetical protein